MKTETKANIIAYSAFILVGLAIAGVAAYITFNKPASVCAEEPIALTSPTSPALITDAMQQLADAGMVPTLEDGLEPLSGAQYIFDPEEHELEYWLVFQTVGGTTAAEFNFSCPLNQEGFPLDIEFEGMRGL